MLEEILVLVDSLQQEQPCDTCTNDKGCVTCKDGELWEGKEHPCEDLDEATARYGSGYCDIGLRRTAEFGFRSGAEWQRQRTPMPEDTVIFQKGIEEGKRLMMEDAVDADIKLTLHDKTGDLSIHTGYLPKELPKKLGFRFENKVKVLIIKEDMI